jgi:hypothetical protein
MTWSPKARKNNIQGNINKKGGAYSTFFISPAAFANFTTLLRARLATRTLT